MGMLLGNTLSEKLRKFVVLLRRLSGKFGAPRVLQVFNLAFCVYILSLDSFISDKPVLLTEVINI
jgi:hypothetical protein